MRKHYLESVFHPRSVAVICGGNYLPLAEQVMRNLEASGYEGDIYPVGCNGTSLAGRDSVGTIADVGIPVDLAVISASADRVAGLVRQCGECKVSAVVVLSAGFVETEARGQAIQAEIVELARSYNMNLVGPDCLGIVRPSARFNASSVPIPVADGKVALVTQSGSFCAAILDWADANGFGFSAVASLGATSDVKLGDVLDYLAQDPRTRSILLYVERITNARRFLSGLRAAARLKPVVVIKSGRNETGARAALSHIHTPLGSDAVFDAALRRAGAVRVHIVSELFAAARILATGARVNGDSLAVITNGGGPGVMAADWAGSVGVRLAQLGEETVRALSEVLPEHWSHSDPVDILGGADGERYRRATELVLADKAVDGLLVLLTPQGVTNPTACAEGVIAASRNSRKPVLASWMGETSVRGGRAALAAAGISQYEAPEQGVDAFAYLAAYWRNQNSLLQVPEPLGSQQAPDIHGARRIVERALAESRSSLARNEVEDMLAAFRLPVQPGAEGPIAAEAMGAVSESTALRIGISRDSVFGPVISLGAAGDAVELLSENQVSLPPLNDFLCRELIRGTRAYRLLDHVRRIPEADLDNLVDVLQRVSEIACEIPQISALDIDPLLVGESGVIILEARIEVAPPAAELERYGHMAIHPYPQELESRIQLRDGAEVLVRPIRPEDGKSEASFVENLSAESRYFRFMHGLGRLTPLMLVRFTQIDYDREMALVAVPPGSEEQRIIAVARYVTNADGISCEFALTVADEWHARGIGTLMMERLIEVAAERSLATMMGEVLVRNTRMLRLCKRLGFTTMRSPDDPDVMVVTRPL